MGSGPRGLMPPDLTGPRTPAAPGARTRGDTVAVGPVVGPPRGDATGLPDRGGGAERGRGGSAAPDRLISDGGEPVRGDVEAEPPASRGAGRGGNFKSLRGETRPGSCGGRGEGGLPVPLIEKRADLTFPQAMRRARLAWPASVSRPRRLLSTEVRTGWPRSPHPLTPPHTQQPAFEHLEYTLEPARKVLRVTLNRPDLHNAFNEHVIAEITRGMPGGEEPRGRSLTLFASLPHGLRGGGQGRVPRRGFLGPRKELLGWR